MTEIHRATAARSAASIELELHRRLDAVRSEHTAGEFVDDIASLLRAAPTSAWSIVAERHRRGELSAPLLRSIASKIVSHELVTAPCNSTVDLQTPAAGRTPAAINGQDADSPVEIGRVLRDRYVLEKRLGSGGMGTVFKALDRYRCDLSDVDQYVAIKILHKAIDNRPERLANLRREFYCTQRLSHRNVVKVYELDRDGDIDFFTMELLEGELLSSVIESMKLLPMHRPYAWAIVQEIGSGLAHAHARNVVHADLKPHNIMITDAGEVRILDFGASRTSLGPNPESAPRRISPLPGVTPAYACCELLAGRAADPRDDIYSFACIAYELLAGTHPFQRRPATIARDLAILPLRPPGLGRRQWQALAMGLSWHRAGRSISVTSWLDKLHGEREAARQLPRPHDLISAPEKPHFSAFHRAPTLVGVLLISVTVWASLLRLASGDKISDDGTVPIVAAHEQLAAHSAMTPVTHSVLAGNAAHAADLRKPRTALPKRNLVSAGNYSVRNGEKFAEIHVRRSAPSRGNDSFVWWTEAASAKPGIDFIQQAKVTQSFPKGKNSTSFFIKLVPQALRTQREVFYIAIADADHSTASSEEIARAAIWLPPTHDHS
jgi:serine/threonine protein kinase